ncbi:MAG TPA: hypothetical protein VJB12_04215 [Candidatus Nanoarchaeia archaeon]|nr:hypothetical protein [Candidatus Nanoarchaeia archaeon]
MNQAAVFVKIDEYKQVLDTVEIIKKNLAEAKKVLTELNAIKDAENAELTSWGSNLDEIEAKLNDIDRMMIEPGQW